MELENSCKEVDMSYEETKVEIMDAISECDDIRDKYLMTKALADLVEAGAEEERAKAEQAKANAEAWRCESNEAIAKTEAKSLLARCVLDNGAKIACCAIAAKVTDVGYRLITEHEITGCVTSAIKGILPKLKFW